MSNTFLTPAQVAERMHVDERTVAGWIISGKLDGVRIGRAWRVPEKSAAQFLAEQSVTAVPG